MKQEIITKFATVRHKDHKEFDNIINGLNASLNKNAYEKVFATQTHIATDKEGNIKEFVAHIFYNAKKEMIGLD